MITVHGAGIAPGLAVPLYHVTIPTSCSRYWRINSRALAESLWLIVAVVATADTGIALTHVYILHVSLLIGPYGDEYRQYDHEQE